MLLLQRALGILLVLATGPQAVRTVLGRCEVSNVAAKQFDLPDGLREVSGLARGPGRTLLTHGDERGAITVLDAATLKVVRKVHLRGNPRDDFEGIAAAGDSVALMTSGGSLYFFRLGTADTVPFTTVATGLALHCELEGLGWHRASGTMLMPCKEPKGKAVPGLTVFRYRLGRAPGRIMPIVVQGSELARVTGLAKVRATGVEVDQVTGHLVVLSSRPAMLVEIDSTGRAVNAKALQPSRHPQSEGLTLTPDAIWIADEGTGRTGTLMRYACR